MGRDVASEAAMCAVIIFLILTGVLGLLAFLKLCFCGDADDVLSYESECVGVYVVGEEAKCGLCYEPAAHLLEFRHCNCRNRVCSECARGWDKRLLQVNALPWCPFCRGGISYE